MKAIANLALSVATLFPATALAQRIDEHRISMSYGMNAGELATFCAEKTDDDRQAINNLACLGFLVGFDDTVKLMVVSAGFVPGYCLPKDGARPAMLKAYRTYMAGHADRSHEPAALISLVAFRAAYPCPERAK